MPISFLKQRYVSAPLALPTIAGLTPNDVEVCITDENVEPVDFEEKVDLVAITFNVSGIIRAYEIADEFRRRGVPVVLGGILTSMVPDEALFHADAIVLGEAEGIWQEVVNDFRRGRLQRVYRNSKTPDLKDSPIPRWDLLRSDRYFFHHLQTTRGCPFNCDFCSVTWFFGGKYRHKPVEKVVEEVKFLQKIDRNKLVFIVDDNFISNPAHAKDLAKALIPLKMRWYGQAPITVAEDEDLLELLRESGCVELFIGFESLSQNSLDAMGKGKVNKVAKYEQAIEKIYSHGIKIFGSFMLGGEYDDEAIFEKTVKFVNDNNIRFSLVNIVTPPPGTRLFQRLEKEGRILHKNWEKYTAEFVTFTPNLMSAQKLQDGFLWTLKEIYSYGNLFKRLNTLNEKIFPTQKGKQQIRVRKLLMMVALIIDALVHGKLNRVLFLLKCLMKIRQISSQSVLRAINAYEYSSDPFKSHKK